MTSATQPNHQYHLVEPSPWPLAGAASLFFLAFGLVGILADNRGAGFMPSTWAIILFAVGVLGIGYTLLSWWCDVVIEAEHDGHHTPVVQLHMRYGMVLFILSEVMFFVAWFWAFFDVSLAPAPIPQSARAELTGGMWPPEDITPFVPWKLPLINTLVLLLSGATVTYAHRALFREDRVGLKWGLIVSILLGGLFTVLQAYEYGHAAFEFGGHIYGSTFFMATGFHGAHVIIGTLFLTVCAFRVASGHFRPSHHFGFEAAAWYWHFVDVVWLFLFIFVYVVPELFPVVAE